MEETREGQLTGWLWKRAPRTTDRDKNYVRRMLLSSRRYRRRFFVLNHDDRSLRYFDDDSGRSSALGAIDLRDILDVNTTVNEAVEKAPTQFILNIRTCSRLWLLCAESEDARLEWLVELRRCLPTGGQEYSCRRVARGRVNGKRLTVPSIVKITYIGARIGKPSSIASDETPEVLVHGNIYTQHARWQAVESTWQTMTGNVPVMCTSYWSEQDPTDLAFVNQFANWCSHFDPISYVTNTMLDHCAFVVSKIGVAVANNLKLIRDSMLYRRQ